MLTLEKVMGDYKSLEEMRMADGWPTLKEAAGKIIILLYLCDVTEEYISIDTSVSSQAMFLMLRFEDADKDCTSFTLDNDLETAIENCKKLLDKRILW